MKNFDFMEDVDQEPEQYKNESEPESLFQRASKIDNKQKKPDV